MNRWAASYITADDAAPEFIKARYPLRQCGVEVFESPDIRTASDAVLFVRPAFQVAFAPMLRLRLRIGG